MGKIYSKIFPSPLVYFINKKFTDLYHHSGRHQIRLFFRTFYNMSSVPTSNLSETNYYPTFPSFNRPRNGPTCRSVTLNYPQVRKKFVVVVFKPQSLDPTERSPTFFQLGSIKYFLVSTINRNLILD